MNTFLEISVISTVKNGERTIGQTIESVINQTYNNWEFIIVDDGSFDNTEKIIKQYILDKRIKYIKTSGIGRGKALNLAVQESIGTYIVNIDADDLMHPEKLQIQLAIMKSNRNYFLISTLHRIIYDNQSYTWKSIDENNILIEDLVINNLKKNQIDHSSIMMRKTSFLMLGGYDENRKSQFDYELWLRAGFNGEKIGRINRKMVAKRIHDHQSFEKKRVGQLTRSITLQFYYIIKQKKILFSFYPIGRLLLGMLPFKFRRKIRNIIKL